MNKQTNKQTQLANYIGSRTFHRSHFIATSLHAMKMLAMKRLCDKKVCDEMARDEKVVR